MICPKCGNELDEGSSFCNHCGFNLSQFSKPVARVSNSGQHASGNVYQSFEQTSSQHQIPQYPDRPTNQLQPYPQQQQQRKLQRVAAARPIKKVKEDKPWEKGIMILLVIATICAPLVGIIAGAIGMSGKAKKRQGTWLLVIGILMVVLWPTLLIVGCTVGCAAITSGISSGLEGGFQ